MNKQKFIDAYNESRNGCNEFYQHPLGYLRYSDGVQELAIIGCYWLIDIIATEVVKKFRSQFRGARAMLIVEVKNESAYIKLEFEDGVIDWSRSIRFTDMPEGTWTFELVNEGMNKLDIAMILPSEH